MAMNMGVGLATKAERGLEYYKTPAVAAKALLAIEGDRIPQNVWEPACGDGAIAIWLQGSGRNVMATDIADRGYGARHDFLGEYMTPLGAKARGIVTNPPFSLAREFVDRSFHYSGIHYVAMLLRLSFLESQTRKSWFEANPPARVLVSSTRLPMMHREGYTGKKSTSTTAHAWFVWLRGHNEEPVIRWFDWRDHAA